MFNSTTHASVLVEEEREEEAEPRHSRPQKPGNVTKSPNIVFEAVTSRRTLDVTTASSLLPITVVSGRAASVSADRVEARAARCRNQENQEEPGGTRLSSRCCTGRSRRTAGWQKDWLVGAPARWDASQNLQGEQTNSVRIYQINHQGVKMLQWLILLEPHVWMSSTFQLNQM